MRIIKLTQRKFPKNFLKKEIIPWTFILPALLVVIIVTFLPVIQAVNLSFHETKFLETGAFSGLENYKNFFQNSLSLKNISNSAIFTFSSLALAIPIAVILALLLEQPFRGRGFFQTILILPWVVSQLLTALLWQFISSPLIGPLAYIIGLLTNTSRVEIFGSQNTAMIGLIIANVWRTFPYAMILTLASLQTVPKELIESAVIDGANRRAIFWSIKFPLIRNTLLIAIIILSIHYINMIELPLILTGGGPLYSTDLLGLRVFREAFVLLKFGGASAIAMVMFAINIFVSLIYIRVLRAEKYL